MFTQRFCMFFIACITHAFTINDMLFLCLWLLFGLYIRHSYTNTPDTICICYHWMQPNYTLNWMFENFKYFKTPNHTFIKNAFHCKMEWKFQPPTRCSFVVIWNCKCLFFRVFRYKNFHQQEINKQSKWTLSDIDGPYSKGYRYLHHLFVPLAFVRDILYITV